MYSFPQMIPPFPKSVLGTQTRRNFLPYFGGCLGALDGTHLLVFTPESLCTAYRNKKGEVTQNVLMACTLDMRIVYGGRAVHLTAAYLKMLSLRTSGSPWDGTYYLGNAGYANLDAVLVPYWNVRYHIKEWGSVNSRCVIAVWSSSIYSNISCLDLEIIKNNTIFDMHSFGM